MIAVCSPSSGASNDGPPEADATTSIMRPSAHDDLANSAAGALVSVLRAHGTSRMQIFLGTPTKVREKLEGRVVPATPGDAAEAEPVPGGPLEST